jgi:hypothetical protein
MRIYETIFIKSSDIRALCRGYNGHYDLEKHGFESPPHGLGRDVNLLFVCKTIAEEASAILYSKNTFWLYDTSNEKIREWLVKIGERNRQLLRSLRIDFAYGVRYASYFGSVQDLIKATLAIVPNPLYSGMCKLLEDYELRTIEIITSTLACLSQGHHLTSFQLRLPGRNGGLLPDELMVEDIARFFFYYEAFEKYAVVRNSLYVLGHIKCLSVGPVADMSQLEAIGNHLKVDELYTFGPQLQVEDIKVKGWILHTNEGDVEYKRHFNYS